MNTKKLLAGIACLTAMNAGTIAYANADPFACVPFESGLYDDVAALVHDNLIYGYTDSTFAAKHPISRYEMAMFTGKALSGYKKASPADQARISKLVTQFQGELTSMGAQLPGTQKTAKKKTDSDTGTSKGKIGNVEISGYVEHLWNVEHKTYVNRSDSYRYSNTNADKYFDIEVFLNAKANLGGGWTGNLGFFGAKDRSGIVRANENIDGHFDMTRAYFAGPINKRASIQVGRDKSSTFKSIVMGEYWTGGLWTQRINKHLTMNYTVAKPDYSKKTTLDSISRSYTRSLLKYDTSTNSWVSGSSTTATVSKTVSASSTSTSLPDSYEDASFTKNGATYKYSYVADSNGVTYNYTDPNSVATTYVNPGDHPIIFEAVEANYNFSNKLHMDLGWWQTHSGRADYQNTHLGEVMFTYAPSYKWRFTTNLAKSDRDEQNTAYVLGATYGKYNVSQPHTWATQLLYGREGRESYIKSGYDIKSDNYGGKGLEWFFYYVPRKNILATLRYLQVRPIAPADSTHDYLQTEYRAEVDWYF